VGTLGVAFAVVGGRTALVRGPEPAAPPGAGRPTGAFAFAPPTAAVPEKNRNLINHY